MISNEEKIEIIINRLDTLDFIIESFISHAEEFQNKYSLEEELISCNAQKDVLLQELSSLGGSWPKP